MSAHTSEAWAWGSIALAGLSTGDTTGSTLKHMIECGGIEALALAVSKCHARDKAAVLDAVYLVANASTTSVASVESMRIMVEPVLEILATLAEDKRIVTYSLRVLQVLTTDPQSHVIVQEYFPAIFGSLSRHGTDESIQILGLEVVFNMADTQDPRNKIVAAGWLPDRQLRIRLGQSGAVAAAIHVIRSFRGKTLLQSRAARNLWKLAQAAPENRRIILQEGGIAAIIEAMRSHIPEHETQLRSQRGAAKREQATSVSISHASEIEMQANGLQVLWKLAWNEPEIQRKIIEQGGLLAIITAMGAFQGETVIQTWACGALLAIVRTRDDGFNRNAVLRSQGLAAVRSAVTVHGSNNGVRWMCAPVDALLFQVAPGEAMRISQFEPATPANERDTHHFKGLEHALHPPPSTLLGRKLVFTTTSGARNAILTPSSRAIAHTHTLSLSHAHTYIHVHTYTHIHHSVAQWMLSCSCATRRRHCSGRWTKTRMGPCKCTRCLMLSPN